MLINSRCYLPGKHTIGLLCYLQGQRFIPKLHTCSPPFELPDHARIVSGDMWCYRWVSPPPDRGTQKSCSGSESIFYSYFWILSISCVVSIWLRVALGKEVSCALMRQWKEERLLKEEKEEINKLSCICLLYMKVPYKQSLMLINIQSCRNETINVCTKLLTTRCSMYDKCSCVMRGVGWWRTDTEIGRLKIPVLDLLLAGHTA